MGVLNVASQERTQQPTGGGGTDSSETVHIGQRATAAIEEFLTGLYPGDLQISVDWETLSPMLSAAAALATILAFWGWL